MSRRFKVIYPLSICKQETEVISVPRGARPEISKANFSQVTEAVTTHSALTIGRDLDPL